MKYQLRPYQTELVRQVFQHWKAGKKRVLMQSGTGTGKTVMFNHIVNLCHEKGKRVLVIADRKELIKQAWQRLFDAHGIHAGIIMAGFPCNYLLPVQIASIQTLNRRTFPPDIDCVIIDECRGSVSPSYAPVFSEYAGAYFLGVDATPVRTSGQGFDHLYDEMVVGPSIKEMEEAGALVPAKPFCNPIKKAMLDGIKITAGDYNIDELSERMSSGQMTADLVASKNRHAKGLKTICFAVDINHSKAIVQQYLDAGIAAEHIDGEMPGEQRDSVFKRFKAGQFELLSNVGIATYGFDEPSILAVQIARPTKSLALYLQMIGRGTRPFEGKSEYKFLDHANCILEHGMPNSPRNWSLYGKKKKSKEKERVFKAVIEGEEKIFTSKDYPEGIAGLELEEVDEEMLLVMDGMRKFDEIFETAKRLGRQPVWAYFRFVERHEDLVNIYTLRHIEKQLGYKKGWANFKLKEILVENLE
jgi:superfamily II DNA or RNA helicase